MNTRKLLTLPSTAFPTDMDWFSRQRGKPTTTMNQRGDIFVLATTDGRVHILNTNGTVEKSVEAHQGAVLSIKWNHDGSSFATAGEDGHIKMWSQSGMLRSTLAKHGLPIYSLAWSPDASHILLAAGKQLVLQPLQTNIKSITWKAHDGLVLKVDWNQVTGQMLSGAEDCKYKIWDSFGRLLYCSAPTDSPITSVTWSPDGQLFVVSNFNVLHLCDKQGWSYAVQNTETGSLFNLRWSPDGTQVAAAGGNGRVFVAQLTDRWMEWDGFEAAIKDNRTVEVHNLRNGAIDHLEFPDRISRISLKHNHLIAVTTSQCYIYNTSNFNTPMITDLRECNVTLIAQCPRYFLLVDGTNIYVYTYDARLVCSPKQTNLRTDVQDADALTLSNETIGIKNKLDGKVIYLFETESGKPIGDGKPFTHCIEILQIGLDQCSAPLEQRMAFIDRNRDLYLMSVRVFGAARKVVKLSSMTTSLVWAESSNMLAAITNENLTIWLHPSAAFIDKHLAALTTQMHETQEELGKQTELVRFTRGRLAIRRANGSMVSFGVPPYPDELHRLIAAHKWTEALCLCRSVNDKMLWACLAIFAMCAKDLDTAEVAFAEINEVDKVEYIQYVKNLPSKEMQTAEILLLCGETQDAEGVLLQAGLYFRAIMLHLCMYNWNRAIELAQSYKVALDIVLSTRQAYLKQCKRTETLERYSQQTNQKMLDPKVLRERIEEEYQKEVQEKCR
ncbi:unnamed protein product [Dicrocoelium dendriticum]|nr:unnamed protein product [Dicrocoelium dendriticum]